MKNCSPACWKRRSAAGREARFHVSMRIFSESVKTTLSHGRLYEMNRFPDIPDEGRFHR